MASNQLFKLLYGLYYTNIPTMVWGDPGCGKTSTIKFLGKTLNVPVELRSGNKSDPTDFSGIPYLQEELEIDSNGEKILNPITGEYRKSGEKKICYSTPAYIKKINQTPHSILFFDELTTCPPAIQVALLSIIQDCKYGDFEIDESTFRVAAGNYNTITGTHTMSLALMNRFCHIFAKPDPDFFADGIVSNWQNYEIPIINSDIEQEEKRSKYSHAVGEFIKAHPDFISKMPEDIIKETDVAYPTARSWELAIKVLSVLDQNENEYIEELIHGVVGLAVGDIFIAFLADYELIGINLNNYLGKEEEFRLPNPDRHDQVSQIVANMQFYLKKDPAKYYKLWYQLQKVLQNENNQFGDYIGYNTFIYKNFKTDIQLLLAKRVISPKDLQMFMKSFPAITDIMNATSED